MTIKVSERLATVRLIAQELEKRYNIDEIDDFTAAFGLARPGGSWENYYEYARQIISKADVSVLSEIIDDLGIESQTRILANRQMPAIWQNENKLRVFISHLSTEKLKATRLRDALQAHSMSAFVAHEDI